MSIVQLSRIAISVCVLSSVAAIQGCATITSGTTQSVMVKAEKGVVGASCELTDKKGGKWYVPSTPGTATVRKGDGPMQIICRKDGYQVSTLSVDETITGATFGNILLGGGIGILVDAASGAAQQYPDEVIIWMEPEEWSSLEDKLAWEQSKKEYEEAIDESKQSQQAGAAEDD